EVVRRERLGLCPRPASSNAAQLPLRVPSRQQFPHPNANSRSSENRRAAKLIPRIRYPDALASGLTAREKAEGALALRYAFLPLARIRYPDALASGAASQKAEGA